MKIYLDANNKMTDPERLKKNNKRAEDGVGNFFFRNHSDPACKVS